MKTMAIQDGTWKKLPSKEELIGKVEEERRHKNDLTSYLLYVIPVAEKFGDEVFEVAAQSLSESGFDVNVEQLKVMAEEIKSSDKDGQFKEQKDLHVFNHVTG